MPSPKGIRFLCLIVRDALRRVRLLTVRQCGHYRITVIHISIVDVVAGIAHERIVIVVRIGRPQPEKIYTTESLYV